MSSSTNNTYSTYKPNSNTIPLQEQHRKSPIPGMLVGGAVITALGYGFYQFLNGKNQRKANNAMLWRVGLQGGGVVLLFLGAQIYQGPLVQGWLHKWRGEDSTNSSGQTLPDHKQI